MANDLSARMRMARLMGGGGGDSDGIRPVRRTSGTAVSDSAGGKVRVQLSGGDPIEVPTSVAVKAGQTVSLLVSGGVATAVGVAGWGDGVQSQVDEQAAMVRQYADGVLVAKTGAAVGALVNASGSFDVVTLTWANGVPSVSGTLSSFDADSADIGTAATPGASVNLLGGAARFYVKQWDAANPESREVRLNSSGATIIFGVDDEATNGGLWIDPYRSDGKGGKAGCEWPFDAVDLRADKLSFNMAPRWTVGRYVEDKCRSVFTVQGGTVFMSVNTAGDWWSIEGWVNVGPSLFSDYTHDSTTSVPVALRPGERIYFPASTYSGDLLKGYVETDGSIWLYRNENLGSVANWSFSTSWPVGGAS